MFLVRIISGPALELSDNLVYIDCCMICAKARQEVVEVVNLVSDVK